MSESPPRSHVNIPRRAICSTAGMLLVVVIATQIFVEQRRSISLEAGLVPQGWRLRFGVPSGWRDLGSAPKVFGGQTRRYRSQDDSGVLVFTRLQVPPGTTADSLCRWALTRATLGLSQLSKTNQTNQTSQTSQTSGMDQPVQETKLDDWLACETERSAPPTRLRRGWRCRIFGAFEKVASEDESEAYTVELLVAGGRQAIDDALWHAVKESLQIVERKP